MNPPHSELKEALACGYPLELTKAENKINGNSIVTQIDRTGHHVLYIPSLETYQSYQKEKRFSIDSLLLHHCDESSVQKNTIVYHKCSSPISNGRGLKACTFENVSDTKYMI